MHLAKPDEYITIMVLSGVFFDEVQEAVLYGKS